MQWKLGISFTSKTTPECGCTSTHLLCGSFNGTEQPMGAIYDENKMACGLYRSGSVYDSSESKVGSVDASGRVYDTLGIIKGRVNEHGRVWDEKGLEVGKVSENDKKVLPKGSVYLAGLHSEPDATYSPYEPNLIQDGHRAGAGLLLLLGAAEKARAAGWTC